MVASSGDAMCIRFMPAIRVLFRFDALLSNHECINRTDACDCKKTSGVARARPVLFAGDVLVMILGSIGKIGSAIFVGHD
jgi:hypothetical protein